MTCVLFIHELINANKQNNKSKTITINMPMLLVEILQILNLLKN